jgi:large subunit ribosomal protein L35
MMPKQKTRKSIAKRVKVTARGKLLRHRAGAGHLKSRKTPSQLRRFRRAREIPKSFSKQIKRMLLIG